MTSPGLQDGPDYLSAWGLTPDEISLAWHRFPLCTHGRTDQAMDHGGMQCSEIMAATAARAELITIHHNGTLISAASYSRSAVIGGIERDGLLDSDALHRLIAAGATLVAGNIEEYTIPASTCVAALSRHFVAEVEAHAFRTPPGAPGIPIHADGEDNFLLQITGQKRWQIWSRPLATKIHYSRAELGNPEVELVLEPGDVLYIPLGWPHHGRAGPTGSFHITYQILPAT